MKRCQRPTSICPLRCKFERVCNMDIQYRSIISVYTSAIYRQCFQKWWYHHIIYFEGQMLFSLQSFQKNTRYLVTSWQWQTKLLRVRLSFFEVPWFAQFAEQWWPEHDERSDERVTSSNSMRQRRNNCKWQQLSFGPSFGVSRTDTGEAWSNTRWWGKFWQNPANFFRFR